ncbi:MAG: sigma-70 family RNA polymerase sigma factor [Verrucomicrobia bacterium]|nr:sigma-70 family RNA polymerase sigma factor [Verrucomicrobiota bacterium]
MNGLDDNGLPRRAEFPTTHWSVIVQAGQHSTAEATAALEQLCRTYWYPLYAYVRRRGYGPEEAEDLTQEFFARLLQKEFLAGVAPDKGKFRSFLLASLNHFLANEWARAQTAKRGGGREWVSLDDTEYEHRYALEPASETTPEKLFERQWALTLLDQALQRLRQESVAAGKAAQFDRLKGFLSSEGSEPSYAGLAAEWQMTPNAVAAAVYRLRQRYRECVREEIAQTVAGPEELEEELRHLFGALG